MSESSRRGFLKYAGAGVAAAGAAAVVPTALAGSADAAQPKKTAVPSHARGALVAHVDNVHGDAMTLMIEGREVVVHDKELVAQLARHMHAG